MFRRGGSLVVSMLAKPNPGIAAMRVGPVRLCSGEDDGRTSFHVQDADDFRERVLSSPRPVIVQFHADWCGPCKALSPRLEAVVAAMGGKLAIAKVDIDDNQELAMDYGVSAVPTLIPMKDGEVAEGEEAIVGMVEDATLQALANRLTDQ